MALQGRAKIVKIINNRRTLFKDVFRFSSKLEAALISSVVPFYSTALLFN